MSRVKKFRFYLFEITWYGLIHPHRFGIIISFWNHLKSTWFFSIFKSMVYMGYLHFFFFPLFFMRRTFYKVRNKVAYIFYLESWVTYNEGNNIMRHHDILVEVWFATNKAKLDIQYKRLCLISLLCPIIAFRHGRSWNGIWLNLVTKHLIE